MKSMLLPSAAIFVMTNFYRAGGPWLPCPYSHDAILPSANYVPKRLKYICSVRVRDLLAAKALGSTLIHLIIISNISSLLVIFMDMILYLLSFLTSMHSSRMRTNRDSGHLRVVYTPSSVLGRHPPDRHALYATSHLYTTTPYNSHPLPRYILGYSPPPSRWTD